MIIGHFGPALIAHSFEAEQKQRAPTWYYYVASQLPDVGLIAVSIVAGGDTLDPADTPMTASHDLLPVLGFMAVVGFIGWLFSRSWRTAAWGAAMVAAHGIADFISGFKHFVAGADTPSYGFDLYTESPASAVVIEWVWSLLFIGAFVLLERRRGEPVSRRRAIIYTVIALVSVPLTVPL